MSTSGSGRGRKSSSSASKTYSKNSDSKKSGRDSGFSKDKKSGNAKRAFGDKPFAKKKYGSDDRFEKKDKYSRDEKPFAKKKYGSDDRFEKKDKYSRDEKPFAKKKYGSDDRFEKKDKYSRDEKPFAKKKYGSDDRFEKKDKYSRDEKPFAKKKYGSDDRFEKKDKYSRDEKPFAKKKYGNDDRFEKKGKFNRDEKPFSGKKPFGKDNSDGKKKYSDFVNEDLQDDSIFQEERDTRFKKDKFKSKEKFEFKRAYKRNDDFGTSESGSTQEEGKKKKSFDKSKRDYDKLIKRSEKNYGKKEAGSNDGSIRLNRYIANSGVCSRRDADKLIESGAVMINGKVVTQLGSKVFPGDKVQYGGETIRNEKHVYILLNKPKDFITTMDDPQGRKTVMGLIRGACKERVYPVGRLDRNTTGVILFTNDGELTRRLTHPKFLVSKMYHVELNKKFGKEDLEKMRNGLELEDGFIKPDQLEYSGEGKNELGIEIHSGRNRIVRRMFEHLGYDVVKLDRVQFAGLNKKDIPRGKYRFLTEKEVGFLKML